MEFEMTSMLGLIGAGISGVAYLPQIIHLIKEHCSAGISIKAYGMWFASSILITISAIAEGTLPFIALGVMQIAATATIFIFSNKYKGQTCPAHRSAS